MAYNTRFSKEEIKRIGLRLHSARVLTGLNREEFSEKNGLPPASIKNWEIGRALPRQEGMNGALSALKSCGVFVSLEWILYGSGAAPSYLETETFEQKDNSDGFIEEQATLFKKAQRAQGLNPIVVTVRDDAMFPIFKKMDTIGGIIIDPSDAKEIIERRLEHAPWLVTLSNGDFIPAWLFSCKERWFFHTEKNKELQECLSPVIVRIKWHYRA